MDEAVGLVLEAAVGGLVYEVDEVAGFHTVASMVVRHAVEVRGNEAGGVGHLGVEHQLLDFFLVDVFPPPGEVDVVLEVDESAGDHSNNKEDGGNVDNGSKVGDKNQEDERKTGEDIEESVAKAFLLLDELTVGRGEGACLIIHNILCLSVLYAIYVVDTGFVYLLQI